MSQELKRVEQNGYDDEIDLMELIMILVREKKTILITFIIVTLLSLGGALYERNVSKKAVAIINLGFNAKNFNQNDLLLSNVLDKVYQLNDIRQKNKLSLDEFRDKFKIEGIIPKAIEDKKEFLAKSGQILEYTPQNYSVQLRVGSPSESKKILEDYYVALNDHYRFRNESRYKFKTFDSGILEDSKYDFQDYLTILELRKAGLKENLSGRESNRLDYASYGFGYRQIKADMKNLEEIRIQELKNFLIATNIVKNESSFKSEFTNRKDIIENSLEEKERASKNYKTLLDSYKMEDKNIVVPKGVKVSTEENAREVYYTELMDDYLKIQMEIVDLKTQLKELEYKNSNLRTGTPEERAFIIKNLKDIIMDYNKIVINANRLEKLENYIASGSLIKLASPIEIVSNSKAKLILAVGMVMGVFLGIMMAFMKNFYHSFKHFHKGMTMLAMFVLLGVNGYAKEEITIQFTHKEMKQGLNPDKTPFNLKYTLINNFLGENLKLNTDDINEILVEPIYTMGSSREVEKKIKSEEYYLYIPTEYKVTIDLKNKELEKKIVQGLKKSFPLYYVDYFLNNDIQNKKIDYIKTYDTYREALKGLNNFMANLNTEIKNREKNANTKEIAYEYRNLEIELAKIRDTRYRDLVNYINSNKIVANIDLERILLKGEQRYINNRIENLKSKEIGYMNILKRYNISQKEAVILESGDISMSSGTGNREKQYIELSKEYLAVLNESNHLKRSLSENQKLSNGMRMPTDEEKKVIVSDLKIVQDEINKIFERMRGIEQRDYRREYIGSVKVL